MQKAKTSGNGFVDPAPERDSSGVTAQDFADRLFEFEYCEECHGDIRNHTFVIGPFGAWQAVCHTIVVFRVWKSKENGGGVLALFPKEPGDNEGVLCGSYEHIGQHGSADYYGCILRTRPAKPEEYAELAKELESIGYNLDIRKRAPAWRRAA